MVLRSERSIERHKFSPTVTVSCQPWRSRAVGHISIAPMYFREMISLNFVLLCPLGYLLLKSKQFN